MLLCLCVFHLEVNATGTCTCIGYVEAGCCPPSINHYLCQSLKGVAIGTLHHAKKTLILSVLFKL